MRKAIGVAAAAAGAWAVAAQAQQIPRYIPTRDVVITYAVRSDQPNVPSDVTVHISTAGRMRIDAGDKGVVLYDAATNRARWVLPQAKMVIDLPVRGSLIQQFAPQSGAHFARAGAETVAGLRCTDWHVTSNHGDGTACVTPDGIILRGDGEDGKGHTGAIEATTVTYEPQPESLFEPPPGTQTLSFPKGFQLPRMPPQ